MARLAPVALASLGLLAACGSGVSNSSVEAAGVEAVQIGSAGQLPTDLEVEHTRLLERMERAQERTRFAGIRRVEQRFSENGVPQVLEYREDAACDGNGLFALDVIEVLSGVDDVDLFQTLQHGRQVFTFNYRDFQIVDLGSFRENYRVRVLSNNQIVAGHPCLELHVSRQRSDGRHYLAFVEPATGLALKWEYRTNAGALLASAEFESIDFDPDLSNYLLQDRQFGGEVVDPELDLGGQVGFNVLTPNMLPAGFGLEEAQLLVGALGRSWFKRTYTDGLSRLAFLHREPESIDGPTDERNLGVIQVMQVGRWNVASGNLQGYEVILMGQVDQDELFQLLQSSF